MIGPHSHTPYSFVQIHPYNLIPTTNPTCGITCPPLTCHHPNTLDDAKTPPQSRSSDPLPPTPHLSQLARQSKWYIHVTLTWISENVWSGPIGSLTRSRLKRGVGSRMGISWETRPCIKLIENHSCRCYPIKKDSHFFNFLYNSIHKYSYLFITWIHWRSWIRRRSPCNLLAILYIRPKVIRFWIRLTSGWISIS